MLLLPDFGMSDEVIQTIIICGTVIFVCIAVVILFSIISGRRRVSGIKEDIQRAIEENRIAGQSIIEAETSVGDCEQTSRDLNELTNRGREIIERIEKRNSKE